MTSHFYQREQRKFPWSVILAILLVLLACYLLLRTAPDHRADSRWQLVVCDVSQGSAALVRTGEASALVVDTGEKDGALLACLDWAGVEAVDAVFLSHSHADHTGGLGAVAQRVSSQNSLEIFCPQAMGANCSKESLASGALSFASTQNLVAGQHLTAKNTSIDVLAPQANETDSNPNASSLVLSVSLGAPDDQGHFEALLPADSEEETLNRALAASSIDEETDLLVLAHHGSRNSGTDYISESTAQIAVVSAGKNNSYGHPHQEIVDSLRRKHIELLSTAESGHLAFYLEDQQLVASPQRKE
ncbi:ComEC/Rec2 family competence protein [Rothia aerolata]|uniref:Metallo-beta-lactamase domain-containing protein n=1 Tax=Rothia aerolata TaxID=1812262 RepID=A0A917IMC4_9MICC|nr:MBL fold metallo-hydrolase [Rothia aerolata]GGH57663.1 hypothetical protein GCM10007359_03040 [Rothia aerolata]